MSVQGLRYGSRDVMVCLFWLYDGLVANRTQVWASVQTLETG